MPQAFSQPLADTGVPQGTTFQFPSIVRSSQQMNQGMVPNIVPGMTAETMLARLPTIVQPVVVDVTPQCATGFTGWVNQNPGMAGVILVLIAAWAWGAGR